METISFSQVAGAINAVIIKLEEKSRELDRLDSPIGDGDHGRTISNAFRNIKHIIDSEDKDIGKLLSGIGKSLAFSAGAAAGPLYGTGFMDAGKVVIGRTEIGLQEIVEMSKAFEEGIKRRGKAQVGDKTMLDTIHPAVESVQKSLQKKLPLKKALLNMKEEARKGMISTKELISQRGRSSRLGERSKGHIDPGAASSYFILEAIVDFMTNSLAKVYLQCPR